MYPLKQRNVAGLPARQAGVSAALLQLILLSRILIDKFWDDPTDISAKPKKHCRACCEVGWRGSSLVSADIIFHNKHR